jgi:hypothetical protein
MSVTGEFLLDARAKWNIEEGFDYQRAIYAISMTCVQYTNDQWFALMRSIQDELYERLNEEDIVIYLGI